VLIPRIWQENLHLSRRAYIFKMQVRCYTPLTAPPSHRPTRTTQQGTHTYRLHILHVHLPCWWTTPLQVDDTIALRVHGTQSGPAPAQVQMPIPRDWDGDWKLSRCASISQMQVRCYTPLTAPPFHCPTATTQSHTNSSETRGVLYHPAHHTAAFPPVKCSCKVLSAVIQQLQTPAVYYTTVHAAVLLQARCTQIDAVAIQCCTHYMLVWCHPAAETLVGSCSTAEHA
jgi:hypothetical protein